MKLASKFIDNFVHSSLGDLQGGKEGEHYHLTKAEWERVPIKPAIESPEDGATNINQVPMIKGSRYYHPYNVPMYGREIQIATDAEFENIVYELPDLEKFSESTAFQIPVKADETYYLTEGTLYFVRIRYQNREGKWSDWSDTSTFTTMDVFSDSAFLAPIMLMPVDGGEVPQSNPILAMSRSKVIAGTANFTKADWQVSTDPTFTNTLYNAQGISDVTMHWTENLHLGSSIGTEFYARGRQWPEGWTAEDADKIPWAPSVHFTVRPDYEDPIFGLRRVFSKRYKRTFVYNIDQEGKEVHIKRSYWEHHPLYAFPEENVLLGMESSNNEIRSAMKIVPQAYIKSHVYEDDKGDTVIDTWYSATEQKDDGWYLDPAFVLSPNGIMVSTYLVGTVGSNSWMYKDTEQTLGNLNVRSLYGRQPGKYSPIPDVMKNDGWHLWTIYERRLLLDLMTAETLTVYPTDVSPLCGVANNNLSPVWRGFYSLFNLNYAFNMTELDYQRSNTRNYKIAGVSFKSPGTVLIAPPNEPLIEDESRMASFDVSGLDELTYETYTSEDVKLYNVSEIHTGWSDAFEMELGLLGIPALANSEGVAAFPMVIPENSLMLNDTSQRHFGMGRIVANRVGLFGLGGIFSTYPASFYYDYFRISKWLD